MRKFLLFTAVLLIAAGSADAGRKREKSGSVTDNVFTDAKYGFTLKASDNWNAKTMDGESDFRVAFTQKKFEIPSDYVSTPDYTKVPRILLFVDTTQLGPFAFVDSLVSRTFKSKQKSEVLKEFDLLAEPELLPKARTPFTLGTDKGVRWDGRAKYTKQVQISASDVGAKIVHGVYSGSILAVKHDKYMLVFHVMCEDMSYQTVMSETLNIINSLTWPATETK
jgi:hypothetical protein